MEEVGETCVRAGRKTSEVQIMAVSKFKDLQAVRQAYDAGVRLFGESRVQEAAEKFSPQTGRLEPFNDIQLHLIGSLQRNKAKKAAAIFDCIQSVDRTEVIEELGKITHGRTTPLPVLLELNAGEDSKSGFPNTDGLCRAAENVLGLKGLTINGLMTMAPWTDNDRLVRHAFSNLKKAQQILTGKFPDSNWQTLSMGMSGDFKIAIQEGSTLIRIGTAIFGGRAV